MNELTNTEIGKYLNELNNQEASELPDDMVNDKAWTPWRDKNSGEITAKSKDELNNDAKKGRNSRTEIKNERNKHIRELKQKAINEGPIDLNTPLTLEHKKQVIQIGSNKYTELMKKLEIEINTVFHNQIIWKIPPLLRKCWASYPNMIIPMEPFTYQASNDFGKSLTFRIDADAPGFYSTEDLLNIISINNPQLLINVDRKIVRFYKYKEAQLKYETILANKLISMKTFFDLLNKEPILYEELINSICNEKNNS